MYKHALWMMDIGVNEKYTEKIWLKDRNWYSMLSSSFYKVRVVMVEDFESLFIIIIQLGYVLNHQWIRRARDLLHLTWYALKLNLHFNLLGTENVLRLLCEQ